MSAPVPIAPRYLKTAHGLLATGFGSGLSPRAPGTVGSAAALPVFLLMWPLPLPIYLALTALWFAVGVWASARLSRELEVHDHGGIVIDEFAGLLIALTACPPSGWAVALGWVAFRVFDILKPWPIGWLDRRVSGGLGIMLDDVVAGLYALAVVQLAARWWQV